MGAHTQRQRRRGETIARASCRSISICIRRVAIAAGGSGSSPRSDGGEIAPERGALAAGGARFDVRVQADARRGVEPPVDRVDQPGLGLAAAPGAHDSAPSAHSAASSSG